MSAAIKTKTPGASPLTLLLGLAAIALSATLIPQGRELALLRLEAGDTQRALSILEQRVADGDRSPATIGALARARANADNVSGAAQLLEGLVAVRPRDAALLNALAGFQRTAGRTEGLILTLSRLQQISARADHQREMAALLGETNRKAEQLEALRWLVDRNVAQAGEYLAVGRLEADLGRPGLGAAALRAMRERYPASVDASVVGLELSMLVAANAGDQALEQGRRWLSGRSDLAEAAPILAGSLAVGGRPDLAVNLLEPFSGPGAGPRLVATLAQAESDSGGPALGLERLERLDVAGTTANGMPAALLRMRLALAVGDIDRTALAAERLGWSNVPSELLLRLSENALVAGRTDVIRHIAMTVGEAHLVSVPVLAGRLTLALGDAAGAVQWSERAGEVVIGQPHLAVQLAELDLLLGRKRRAADLMYRALQEPELPESLLRAIASVVIQTGQTEPGMEALAALRRERPSAAADQAWAVTATAALRSSDVMAWIATLKPEALPVDLVEDLFQVAMDVGATGLAIELAEHLATIRDSGEVRLRLVRMLLDAGQPVRALDHLRKLPADARVSEELRSTVLLAAWRHGAPVRDELLAVWLHRLDIAAIPAERDAAISMLLEMRAHAEILATVRALALQAPERWLWTYAEIAAAAGRRGDVPLLWEELAKRSSVPLALRRQLAFRLLETGSRRPAEQVFRVLAAAAPPDGPDVRQLLYLWGPSPSSEQLDWIENRARRAGPEALADWMRILSERGASARVIAVYQAKSELNPSEAVLDAYLTAAEVQGNRATMTAALRIAMGRVTTRPQLQRLARLAERVGDVERERQVLERLMADGDTRPEVQRRLGTLAYLRRDMNAAQRMLATYVVATGGDAETLTLMGDIALRQRNSEAARRHYAEALERLDSSGSQVFRSRVMRANLLEKLGRDTEAMRLYDDLVAERPADHNLRADYVALLMKQGALRQARAVLDNR
jgi:tetratricopeptide (TPR) repeat protein